MLPSCTVQSYPYTGRYDNMQKLGRADTEGTRTLRVRSRFGSKHYTLIIVQLHNKVFTVWESESLLHPFTAALEALPSATHWLLVALLPNEILGLFCFQPRLVYAVG